MTQATQVTQETQEGVEEEQREQQEQSEKAKEAFQKREAKRAEAVVAEERAGDTQEMDDVDLYLNEIIRKANEYDKYVSGSEKRPEQRLAQLESQRRPQPKPTPEPDQRQVNYAALVEEEYLKGQMIADYESRNPQLASQPREIRNKFWNDVFTDGMTRYLAAEEYRKMDQQRRSGVPVPDNSGLLTVVDRVVAAKNATRSGAVTKSLEAQRKAKEGMPKVQDKTVADGQTEEVSDAEKRVLQYKKDVRKAIGPTSVGDPAAIRSAEALARLPRRG